MFEIEDRPAKIVTATPRPQKHGDQLVPAIYVNLEFDDSNDRLVAFSSKLRNAFYDKTSQAVIEGVAPIERPHLRDLGIEFPVNLRYEGVGYTARLVPGASSESEIVLEDCKLTAIRAWMKDDGRVVYRVQVQCAGISDLTSGRITNRIGHVVHLTLVAPEAGGQAA